MKIKKHLLALCFGLLTGLIFLMLSTITNVLDITNFEIDIQIGMMLGVIVGNFIIFKLKKWG